MWKNEDQNGKHISSFTKVDATVITVTETAKLGK